MHWLELRFAERNLLLSCLHSSIEADVKTLLEGKTYSELEALQSKIESQMCSGTAKVVEYWEAVLTRLHIFKAKVCLKEIHTKMLHKHLQRLEQRVDGEENLDTVYDLQPEEEESEPDVKGMHTFHLWKRVAVLEEKQRRIQEALASKPAPPPEDNFEMKAMKAMGIMEEGDAVLTGSLHL